MPKYSLNATGKAAVKTASSMFANGQSFEVNGKEVTADHPLETLLFLDNSKGYLTEVAAPYFDPIVLNTSVELTASSTDGTIDIPWCDSEHTITITDAEAASVTDTVTVRFNSSTANAYTLASTKSLEITVPKHYIGKVYLSTTATTAITVDVVVIAKAPEYLPE